MTYGRTRARMWAEGGGYLGRKIYTGTTYTAPTVLCKHSCADSTHPGPPYRTGSGMTIKKITHTIGYTSTVHTQKTTLQKSGYDGKFYCPQPVHSIPAVTGLSGYGASGWNATLPVKPVASLGTAIGELRDFPGMIKQTADFLKRLGKMPLAKKGTTLGDFKEALSLRGPSNLGSDYLNLQFGWVPFVSDLLSIFNARENLDKKLSQLRRDNGRPVRRRAVLLHDEGGSSSTGVDTYSSVSPTIETPHYVGGSSPANRSLTVYKFSKDIWYSAVYTYWIPGDALDPRRAQKGFLGLTALERRLLGLELTADVIWNLTPWTWLVDWFSNAGDVVQNMVLNQQYHVVAKHAYVMCHETYEWTRTGTALIGTGTWDYVSSPYRIPVRVWATSSSRYEYKSREKAHPYGFGVTDGDLNPFQWSILAALGLSRLR